MAPPWDSAPGLAIVLSEVLGRVGLASEGAALDTDAGAAVGAGGWDSAGALDGRIGVLRGAIQGGATPIGIPTGTIRFGIRMTRATVTHLPATITTAASAIRLTPTRLMRRRVSPTVFLLRRSTRHPLRKAQPTESERRLRIADRSIERGSGASGNSTTVSAACAATGDCFAAAVAILIET